MAGYVTRDEFKIYYGITHSDDDDYIDLLVEEVSDFIDSLVERYEIGERLWNHSAMEWFDTETFRDTYIPKNSPLVSIDTLEVYKNGTLVETYQDVIFTYNTYFKIQIPISERLQGLKATLTVGFFADTDVPDDLKRLVSEVMSNEYKTYLNNKSNVTAGDLLIKSKKIEDYRIEYFDPSVIEEGAKAGAAQRFHLPANADFYRVLHRYMKGLSCS